MFYSVSFSRHGTFVVGILGAKRGSSAPAICPDCQIILYPVFREERTPGNNSITFPSSTPEELSNAIIETIDAGAMIINLSLGLSTSSLTVYHKLVEAYDYARQKGAIIVVAAGNQGNIGYISLLNHPWIIPVAACDEDGKLSPESNFGATIGKKGLMAPGVNITSMSPGGQYARMGGTSVATPFVTGAIALLWSIYPKATAAEIMYSVITGASDRRHPTIIPPLLNADAAWKILKAMY